MHPRRRAFRPWRPLAAAVVALGLAPAPSADAGPSLQLTALRGGCSLVEVDTIEFQRGRGGWEIYIAGLKPLINMEVSLDHRRAPSGLWTIEVVGCTAGLLGLPVPAPYWIAVPLRDLPGARAVQIVGANGVWRPRLPR